MKNINSVVSELRQVYGAKRKVNKLLVKKFGSNPRIKEIFLPRKRVNYIERYVKKYVVSKNLRQKMRLDIAFHKFIRTYRGIRHKAGLPVRGQKTHSNAKTAKKKRRIQKKKDQANLSSKNK